MTSEAYHGNSELTWVSPDGKTPSGTWLGVCLPQTLIGWRLGTWVNGLLTSDQILDLKGVVRGLPHSLPTACSLQMVYFSMNQECLNRSQWFVRQGRFCGDEVQSGSLARGHGCGHQRHGVILI